jgi:hypothetical protein
MLPHVSCAVSCSELHQLLQLANLLDEHSATTSSLALSFELWHNTQTAELLATLISQHGAKLAGLSVDFRACAADLSGGLRAGSIQAAEAAEQMLAEALQQAAEDAEAHAAGGWVQFVTHVTSFKLYAWGRQRRQHSSSRGSRADVGGGAATSCCRCRGTCNRWVGAICNTCDKFQIVCLGDPRAGSIQAAEAAEQMLAEALQQAAADAAAHAGGGWV